MPSLAVDVLSDWSLRQQTITRIEVAFFAGSLRGMLRLVWLRALGGQQGDNHENVLAASTEPGMIHFCVGGSTSRCDWLLCSPRRIALLPKSPLTVFPNLHGCCRPWVLPEAGSSRCRRKA